MNVDEGMLCRIMLQNRVAYSDGQAYEDLFSKIVGKSRPNFVQVKPQGKVGDRKNDGYDKAVGHYFQVFAPENPKLSCAKAVAKLKTDFKGLNDYWQKVTPVKSFSFVFNDKYAGTFPEIETNLKAIKDEHKLSDCDCFLAKHLEDVLFNLGDADIFTIIGKPPNHENIASVDFSILKEVIDHILLLEQPVPAQSQLVAPNFDEKIQVNGLTTVVAGLLNTGSYQSGALTSYFSLSSNFARQLLRDKLNGLYLEAKQFMDGTPAYPHKADVVFFRILERMSPNGNQPARDAAVIIMAAFFETCDIFEDPKKIATNVVAN